MLKRTQTQALYFFLLLAVGLSACDSTGDTTAQSGSVFSGTEIVGDGLSASASVVNRSGGAANEESSVMEIKITNKGSDTLPKAIHANIAGIGGMWVYDTGANGDAVAGDGTYSSGLTVVQYDSLVDYNDTPANLRAEPGCTVEFAAPGEACGNWGDCPETSILGYETIFCICITECSL